jgi:hypothetical protein
MAVNFLDFEQPIAELEASRNWPRHVGRSHHIQEETG